MLKNQCQENVAQDLRDVVVEIVLRNDVDDRRARDLLRMVEAHAVQHARAAVVTGGVEAVEAERGHDLDLVLRHRAERIVDVLGPPGGFSESP